MTISTNQQLRDHIHNIHDYLNKNGIGYGMTALKIFNVFYGLKLIEPIIKTTGLSNKCKFSKLLEMANNNNKELSNYIDKYILDELCTIDNKINFYIFHQIPKDLCDNVWCEIIKMINKIPNTSDINLNGNIFNYFINKNNIVNSEIGVYFTDRSIINYIIKKINPKINKDGKIKTMIDPFGGSGGFNIEYIKDINKKGKINWKNEIKNIYHCDMNEDIIKIAGLEIFNLVGVFPNEKLTFRKTNTFKDEFIEDNKKLKFDYIFSNPPDGCRNEKNQILDKCEKILTYLKKEIEDINKQLKNNKKNKDLLYLKDKRNNQIQKIENEIDKYNIEEKRRKINYDTCSKRIKDFADKYDLNKELNNIDACSLILFMELLKDNGTCVLILNNKILKCNKYSKIRKILLENFNVKYIIDIKKDQFKNTLDNKSIIIFTNTEEKTKDIIFYDLIVEKQKEDVFEEINDKIVLIKNKNDIVSINDKIDRKSVV